MKFGALMLDVCVERTAIWESPVFIVLVVLLFILINLLCCLRGSGGDNDTSEEPAEKMWRVTKGKRWAVVRAQYASEALNMAAEMWGTDIMGMSVKEVG